MGRNELPYEIEVPIYYMSWLVARFAQSWGEKVSDLREKIEDKYQTR